MEPISSYRTLSYAPALAAAPPPAFQMAELLRLIDKRRALIAKVTLGIVAAAILTALLLPTVWSASAVVMLDARKNNVTDATNVLSQLTADPASVQNQIQILTSRDLAAKVADQLGLYRDPEFNSAMAAPGIGHYLSPRNWFSDDEPDSLHQRDAVLDALTKHVTAEAIGLSTSITVTAKSRDAEKSARIANAVTQAYIGDQVQTKVDAAQRTIQWLGTRVNDLAEQLQVQQAAIQRYKAQHNLNDSGPGNSLVDQSMSGLNAQIVQARSDLAEKQAQYDRVLALQQAGNAANSSSVVASPLIAQLRTQESTLLQQESDFATKYGPLHPKMQAVEAQKRDLDAKINQEVNRIAGSAANDLLVAKSHLGALTGALNGTEREASSQNLARVQLAAMESDATSTRASYEAFVQRLRQAQDQDAVQTPESRIISQAAIPLTPSAPKRSLIVAASLPLGLLLGLLAALMAEKFGPAIPVRVAEPRAAPRAQKTKPRKAAPPATFWNGPPILAQIGGANSLRAADYVIDWPDSRFSHGINALVHQLDGKTRGASIVAVTSVQPGEGKSAIAVALARAAARMGKKTVVVDCDPARLTSRAVGAAVKGGLYDVLTGAVMLNQTLVKDPRSGAYLLGMPRRPANSATMFGSRAMAKLIDVLRSGAEMVILDCGPAPSGPEAALIARHADATLLVARQGAMQSPATASAARLLQDAHAAPVGMVVLS